MTPVVRVEIKREAKQTFMILMIIGLGKDGEK